MPRSSPYDRDLDRNPANYAALSPLSLIARTAYTYPQRLSVIHGDRRWNYALTSGLLSFAEGSCLDPKWQAHPLSGHE